MRPSRQGAGATSGSYSPRGPLTYALLAHLINTVIAYSNRDAWPFASASIQGSNSTSGPWTQWSTLPAGSTPTSDINTSGSGYSYTRVVITGLDGSVHTTNYVGAPHP